MRQTTAAHAPSTQPPEQHWLLAVHSAPSSVQEPTQVPPLQTLEQQSRAAVHASPGPLHGGPQTPFAQNDPAQQPSPQAWSSALQEVQTWLAHVPLQHSENSTQAEPAGLHAPPPPPPVFEDEPPPQAPARPKPKMPRTTTTELKRRICTARG